MSPYALSLGTYLKVFFALLSLLAATIAAAFLPLGRLHLPLALGFATAKAILIGLFFMHLCGPRTRVARVVIGAAMFWLGILLTLTLADYLSRGWVPIPGK
jgi:cytochrome c oxidase subunit 4